jgi:hypothetical protein
VPRCALSWPLTAAALKGSRAATAIALMTMHSRPWLPSPVEH